MLNSNTNPLFRSLFLCSLCATLFSSCDLINPSEPTPAYLRIDSISTSLNYEAFGSSSSNITEAWVFIDGQLQGIHDLPFVTPILSFGEHDISIAAGIKRNGIAGLRVDYPFYTRYRKSVNFNSLDTIILDPIVTYTTGITVFTEDFEDPGLKFISADQSDTGMAVTKDPALVFEKTGSGVIKADSSQVFFLVKTDQEFILPGGKPIFLELNYKTDEDFQVGIIATNNGGSIPARSSYIKHTVDESGVKVWKKIYINLSTEVNQNLGSESFEIYISGQSTAIGQEFFFDNIKLVYRN